ncbi:baseplate J/gp47 family protein [Aneurinibacillus thermoaerophilus]|uniref:baseplate J/gp47 family protein n=1 Tax=Aneurinibacillus thermoaerophilus TaxID=143495 RepID=UPI002E1BE7BE|nr:baseplate J/gp47 family protein [Aneurinibacillus thermoaerophilus]
MDTLIPMPNMPLLLETPEEIYQRMVNRAYAIAQSRGETPPDTEEGSMFYDFVFPIAQEMSEQQVLKEYGFMQAFLPWADGEFLDAHGYLLGVDRKEGEADEDYRWRLIEAARTEEGNGRPIDYEIWAREAGAYGAVAVEKARHDLSIDVYITDESGQPASIEFAQTVRDKMEAKRIALHDLQVHPAERFDVQIVVRLLFAPGTDEEEAIAAVGKRIQDYIRGRSVLVYNQIASLFFVNGVYDYTDYTLNGGTENILLTRQSVPVLSLVVNP